MKRIAIVLMSILGVLPLIAQNSDDTMVWAYYYGSANGWSPLGTGSTGQTFSVAYFVPGNESLKGASINAVNIPVVDSGMKNVTVWVRNNLTEADIAVQDASAPFTKDTYKTVVFNTPVPIPSSGCYVGYTFKNSIAYCIPTAGEPQSKGLFLSINDGAFEDYSSQFGASAHQLIVSNVSLPDHQITLKYIPSKNTVKSKTTTATVYFEGYGKKRVESFDYTLDVAGIQMSKHTVLSSPMEPGFNMSGSFEIEYDSPAELGNYPLEVTLDKVNGEAVTKSKVNSVMLNLSKAVGRRTVVEEFTGTGCGWCPRGWVGMEKLKRDYPDTFIGIAFHKYNTSDPMYVANYYPTKSLGITGAPGCNMNRRQSMDPYDGTKNGIWNDFESFNAELPSVDVTLTATWNEDKTAVNIKTAVEPLTIDLGFTVAYVLTADNLSGTSSSWKQSNYYPSYYSKSDFPNDPELGEFAKGGSKGYSSVALTFNDVMIGSSYNTSGKNLATAIDGADHAQPGMVYEDSYEVKMPTKATLKDAIQQDKVFANVLVISNATGEILNAARIVVKEENVTPELKDPELSFDETTFEVEEESVFTAPELNNPYHVPVTFTSSDVAVAKVDENSGEVSIGTPGTVTITATFAGNDEYLEASASYTITVTEKVKPFVTEINVEREVGLGYGVTNYEPDFTEALAYLGIENPTDATLVGINADGSEEAAPGPGGIDGWCDADGNFVGWHQGGDSRICVKFFPSVPQYEICDMNGADEVGKTYTVKYGLKANDKMATFVINVTFVKSQEVELSLSENVIKARVEYESDEESYVERKVVLTDDQANEIITDLGLASLADATVYGWNPTTEEFVKSYEAYDGWRDANGDFHNWSGNADVPACVKYTDGQTYLCYNIKDCEPQEIKCYWAIANDKRAVLVEITFAYVVPAGINEINADEKAGAIFNINGVKMVKSQQKGIYIVNGKKLVKKN